MTDDECRWAMSRMHVFLDSELESVEADEVRVHVGHCDGCEDEFDAELALRALMQRVCHVEAPASLMSRLMGMHCDCVQSHTTIHVEIDYPER